MFSRLVRARIATSFAAAGRGDTETLARGLAPDVHHRFAGDHALGGERHDRPAVIAWAQRLHRLFPELVFDVDRVTATGFPWAPTVIVEWRAHVTPVVGPSYVDTGVHVIRLRAARVVALHASEDSQAVAAALGVMAAAGVEEASAAPLSSARLSW